MKKILITFLIVVTFGFSQVIYQNFRITKEGGVAIKLTNKSGATITKGKVVSLATNYNAAFILCTNGYKPTGVVYDTSVTNNGVAWIIKNGMADVLLETNSTVIAGNYVYASEGAFAGRVNANLVASTYSINTNIFTATYNYVDTNNILTNGTQLQTNLFTNVYTISYQYMHTNGDMTNNSVVNTNYVTNTFNINYNYLLLSGSLTNTATIFTNYITNTVADEVRRIGYSLIATNNSITNNVYLRVMVELK